jgi:hypothetical protein
MLAIIAAISLSQAAPSDAPVDVKLEPSRPVVAQLLSTEIVSRLRSAQLKMGAAMPLYASGAGLAVAGTLVLFDPRGNRTQAAVALGSGAALVAVGVLLHLSANADLAAITEGYAAPVEEPVTPRRAPSPE